MQETGLLAVLKSKVLTGKANKKYEEKFDKLNKFYYTKKNSSMEYPSYYTRPFHGYDTGNLNWLAATEGEAATLSMAVNYWKGTDPITTEQWLRNNITANIQNYIDTYDASPVGKMVDVGSSIGISTEYLFRGFPNCTSAEGIDLSPFFVAVASYRAEKEELPIEYYHQNAEHASIKEPADLIVCTFILHEVPAQASMKILAHLKTLLKPGGTLAVVDLDPQKVQNNMVVDTFRKWSFEVTEPHIYEYYNSNMSYWFESIGMEHV